MAYLLREWWLVLDSDCQDDVFLKEADAIAFRNCHGGEIVHVQEHPNFGEDDGKDI